MMKRMRVRPLLAVALLLGCTAACGACGASAAPVEAPSDLVGGGRAAFGTNDADFVGVLNLEALRDDPLFGPALEGYARRDDLGVLMRASQIDVVATAERGKAVTWVAVVHGVQGPPGEHDLGSRHGAVVTAPGEWLLGEGAGFERARASVPIPSGRISVPSRVLIASTMRDRALPKTRYPDLNQTAEGLREATLEVLGGSHLELVGRFRYVDGPAAKRAATLARLILARAGERRDFAWQLVRALVKIELDVSGDSVTMRLTIDDDLRDLLRHYVEQMDR
jgi:hypothetical protein